jgi:hypothetical protein
MKALINDICRALYHCNYCEKDISCTPRIRCAICPDFDLCLECFSVGVEVTPHRNHHDYRVVDNLSFPIFHPAWGVRVILCCRECSGKHRSCGLGFLWLGNVKSGQFWHTCSARRGGGGGNATLRFRMS